MFISSANTRPVKFEMASACDQKFVTNDGKVNVFRNKVIAACGETSSNTGNLCSSNSAEMMYILRAQRQPTSGDGAIVDRESQVKNCCRQICLLFRRTSILQ